jgi:hypothetical protein
MNRNFSEFIISPSVIITAFPITASCSVKKKIHAIGQHVDDARAAPLAAAKNIPKLIPFDFLHGILLPQEQ